MRGADDAGPPGGTGAGVETLPHPQAGQRSDDDGRGSGSIPSGAAPPPPPSPATYGSTSTADVAPHEEQKMTWQKSMGADTPSSTGEKGESEGDVMHEGEGDVMGVSRSTMSRSVGP